MTPEERFTKIENALQSLTETQARHESAVRDLITVSRMFLDSQKAMSGQIQELRVPTGRRSSSQKATDSGFYICFDEFQQISEKLMKVRSKAPYGIRFRKSEAYMYNTYIKRFGNLCR